MEDGKVKSAVYLEFLNANDVRFDVQYLGQVHPLQVIAACELLLVQQKRQLLEIIEQTAQSVVEEQNKNKILTPKPKFIMPES